MVEAARQARIPAYAQHKEQKSTANLCFFYDTNHEMSMLLGGVVTRFG